MLQVMSKLEQKSVPISTPQQQQTTAATHSNVGKYNSISRHFQTHQNTVMGSQDRSKKKVQLWKKAVFHFMLCFVMGFLTGFAPTGKGSVFSPRVSESSTGSGFSPQPSEVRSLMDEGGSPADVPAAMADSGGGENDDTNPRRLVIVVTPTSVKDRVRGVQIRRMANTLKLVEPPLLWVVVEQQSDSDEVSEILRQTGIMYRHLVFKENFTHFQTEMDHQRNVALKHVEHHRLSGIVHFAGLSNVYDLRFFEEIRAIEAFGTWPMAFLSANRKRVTIEGPICESSNVMGWHLRNMKNNQTDETRTYIHVSNFAFNSSILWDPERWGRTSPAQDTLQDSLRFVKKEVLDEEAQLKGIPLEDCSRVLVWNVRNWNKIIRYF